MSNLQNRFLRDTGIPAVGPAPWGTHICQFYQTSQDLLEVLVPFFKAGLDGHESCLCLIAEPLTTGDVQSAMRQAMPDFDQRLAAGQMEIFDGRRFYCAGGRFSAGPVLEKWRIKLKVALAHGYQGLRMTGNSSCVDKRDWTAFAKYEAIVNSLISHIRVIALCQYWMSVPQPFDVLDAIRNHPLTLLPRLGVWQSLDLSPA